MKVILFGATGMVGQGVLRECLRDETVDSVIVIGRNSIGQTHPKLRELRRPDMFDFGGVAVELQGYNACFFCLQGCSSGIDSELTKLFDFIYRAELEDGLIEYEYDHVLVGYFNGIPTPNFNEVAEWQWIDLETLRVDLQNRPESYTYWFRNSLNRFQKAFEPIQFKLEAGKLPSHV